MRKTSSLVASLSLLAILGLTALTSWAQLPTATLNGIVTDPNGALVPGAKVNLTSQATGLSREVTSSADGLYVFASLAAGLYDVRVEASGFAAKEHKDIRLEVGRVTTLDVGLEVAPVGQVVTVEGGAATIELTQSQVQGQITASTIENIPLNGRNFLELAFLIPGNRSAPNYDPTKTNTLEVSSAGQFGRGGNLTVDGGDNNDEVVGGTLMNLPQDAIGEFQIATNRFTAEVGRSGSSIINIITKSGTNDLHGSAFIFFRHRELQGRPATDDRSRPEASFDREQIGASLGGPIEPDRAWFFWSFENRNQDGAVQAGERILPLGPLITTSASAPLDDFMMTGRVDVKVRDNDNLTVRYAFNRSLEVANGSSIGPTLGSAANRQSSLNRFQSFLADWTRTISSTKVNSLIFHMNFLLNNIPPFGENQAVTDPPGLAAGNEVVFPGVQDGANFRIPQQTRFDRFQIKDNFSWVRGRHTLKFGAEWQRTTTFALFDLFGSGSIFLTENFPTQDRNLDGVIDDLDIPIATPVLASAAPVRPPIEPDYFNTSMGFYVQDDWRARPNLTLNLGLRWEFDTDIFGEGSPHDACPEPLSVAPAPGERCVWLRSVLGLNRSRGFNNFGPRLGFAWDPFKKGKTVIRGGYGIYYDRVVTEVRLLELLVDGRKLAIGVLAGSTLDGAGNFLPDPVTGNVVNLANPLGGERLPAAGIGITVIDNDVGHPYVQQWTLGLQHEITPNWVISADGIHNFGTRFLIGRPLRSTTSTSPFVSCPDGVTPCTVTDPTTDPLTGFPGSNGVTNIEPSAKVWYDGLLVSLQKRPTQLGRLNYGFNINYTLSKTLNYAQDDQIPFREFRAADVQLGINNLRLEKGFASADERHRFVFFGVFGLPYDITISPILTITSSVPIDSSVAALGGARLPIIPRNALGRDIQTGAELNTFIQAWRDRLGCLGPGIDSTGSPDPNGLCLLDVDPNLKFGDSFNALDVRVTKRLVWRERHSFELIGEVFNLFNITNIRGFNRDYSGFANVLPANTDLNPLTAEAGANFGQALRTAGGFFGSGGPRAFQFALRYSF